MKPSLSSRKKWRFHFFGENSKMTNFGQNWPKFGLNLTISGYIRPEARVLKKISVKNFEKFFLLFFFFSISKKTYYGRKNPHFALMNTIMTPPSPHLLRNIFKFLKWRFFAFLVSRHLAEKRPKESRPFVRSSVRPSVRSFVRHAVSRKPFITFFWDLAVR